MNSNEANGWVLWMRSLLCNLDWSLQIISSSTGLNWKLLPCADFASTICVSRTLQITRCQIFTLIHVYDIKAKQILSLAPYQQFWLKKNPHGLGPRIVQRPVLLLKRPEPTSLPVCRSRTKAVSKKATLCTHYVCLHVSSYVCPSFYYVSETTPGRACMAHDHVESHRLSSPSNPRLTTW